MFGVSGPIVFGFVSGPIVLGFTAMIFTHAHTHTMLR